MTINAISALFTTNASSTADFDVVIYDGTTAVHTQSIDANALAVNDNRVFTIPLSSAVTLTQGTQYYIALKPTTTNAARIIYAVVYNGEMMRAMGWPATTGESTRTDAGAWSSPDTTRLPLICLHVSDVAGSSGIPIARGMHGGMR
jgi:hypothetical protein